MFQSARLKLTAWYLMIIMLISVLFSLAIYNFLSNELARIEHAQQRRVELRMSPFGPGFFQEITPPAIDPAEFEEARHRILFTLLMINLGILAFSGAAGYFLAGRTLKPIQDMVDDQNLFITDASHELRTPITALKSEIEVYLRGKHQSIKDANKLLESNLEEVNNLQILSDYLIQLAQYEKYSSNTHLDKVALSDVIQAAGKKLHTAAKQKSIKIETVIKDCFLLADKERLIQLFGIFLDNAIKYSPENSAITISSKLVDHSVLVNIKDEGMGIDKRDIPHIFDRFYRADSSRTKQNVSGYGLGLSIAKKIIDSYHGSVIVNSDPGKGTVFTVQLPVIKS